MNTKETRFFERKTFLIDFNNFTKVMQEISGDETLTIYEEYPVLSMYSEGFDRDFEEEEIISIIGDHLNENIIACFKHTDLEQIYFICGTEIETIDLNLHLPGVGNFRMSQEDLEKGLERISRLEK